MDVQKTPEWSAIKEYMTNLSFRPKRLGGLDPDSVVEGINNLTSLYNKWVEKLSVESQNFELRERELEADYQKKLDQIQQDYQAKKEVLEKENVERKEQVLTTLQKTDTFCEQLKTQAQSDAESVLTDIELKAKGIVDKAKQEAEDTLNLANRRAEEMTLKANKHAENVEKRAQEKAEKIMEKTLQDAFEISSQAQMLVERSTEERELNEKRIRRMRSETALYLTKMQKALDGVARIGLPEGDEIDILINKE